MHTHNVLIELTRKVIFPILYLKILQDKFPLFVSNNVKGHLIINHCEIWVLKWFLLFLISPGAKIMERRYMLYKG